MKRILYLLCLLLAVCIQTYAGIYTPTNLPVPYLKDETKHVSNPDHILSQQAVAAIDTILFRMEKEKGVQSLLAVVEQIEGGDCYEFGISLGNHYGIGSKANTGLVIILSTKDRCYYILTGEGLEGTLPDAICRRIENQKMLPFLKSGDWDNAMLATVDAIYRIVEGDETLVNELRRNDGKNKNNDSVLFMLIFAGIGLMAVYLNYKSQRNRTCPKCKHAPLTLIKNSQYSSNGYTHYIQIYRCPHCGHTIERQHDEPFDSGTGFGGGGSFGGGFIGGGFFGGGSSGGFGGGSFGGGSFGGGGSGGKF